MAEDINERGGPAIIGRLIALEGFVAALIESVVEHSGWDEQKQNDALTRMVTTAKGLSESFDHPEFTASVHRATDRMVATVAKNLAAMRSRGEQI